MKAAREFGNCSGALSFLDSGGHKRSPGFPRARYIFEESPSCPNFGDRTQTHRCIDCSLMEFVATDLRITPASGAQARILVTGHPSLLKPEVQHQMYLIGREALVNALHHSKASSIEVEVSYLRSHLRVLVWDNGCGIDEQIVEAARASHWGLLRMRDQAKGIGAEIRLYSRRGWDRG